MDEEDDQIRAMIAISLGCDVIPGAGIHGVGSSTLVELFNKFEKDGENKKVSLKNWMAKKWGLKLMLLMHISGHFCMNHVMLTQILVLFYI